MKALNLALGGILCGLSFLLYLNFAATGSLPRFAEQKALWCVAACWGALVFFSWKLLYQAFDQLISWRKLPGTRLLLTFVADIGSLQLFTALTWLAYSTYGMESASPLAEILGQSSHPLHTLFIRFELLAFSVTVIGSLLQFSWYSYRYYTEFQLMESRLLNQQAELEQELLQEQLSPHYLFNCLNTIASLVTESAEKSELFIRKTAESLQYIMDCKGKNLVSLHDELTLMEAFCFQMKIRYGQSFKVTCQVPKAVRHLQLPPLTLQLLIENALKHNSHSEAQPLLVEVNWQEAGSLLVRNSLSPHEGSERHSTKTGLENLQKRLQFLSNKAMAFRKTAHHFEVEFPLIAPDGLPAFHLRFDDLTL